MPWKVVSLLVIAALAPLAGSAAEPAGIIPAEVFFKNPEFRNVRLSPDGKKIGVLTRQDRESLNLVVLDLDSGKHHQVTSLEDSNVYWYQWVTSDRLVFYYRESTPRIAGYYVAELGGKARRLGRDDRFWTAKELGLDESAGAFYSRRDGNRGQLGRCRLGEGVADPEKQLAQLRRSLNRRTRISSYLLDQDCRLRVATAVFRKPGDFKSQLLYRSTTEDDWRVLREQGLDEPAIQPLAFGYDEQHMFVATDIGRTTRAVYYYDPEADRLGEMIYGDDVYDVANVLLSDTERKLLGVSFAAESLRVKWLEPDRIALGDALAEALPEYSHYFQFSTDGRHALVRTVNDRAPVAYWRYNAEQGTLREILRTREWIDPKLMARVEPIEFEARDGLKIRGFLTRPTTGDEGTPPMIVYPHGGPHGIRDTASFRPSVQFFANRGYAVLQIDFRGSGGYGRDFLNAGLQEFGQAIQNDITDGLHWALEQGYADPERVCIYGGSFGGYAALMGVVLDPELYRCAVSFAGVSHLREMGGPYSTWFARQVGDFWDEVERLNHHSPALRADEIQVPVLLIHGLRDRTVRWTQTQMMVEALKEHGKTVEVIYYEDEGHGFYHVENRIEAHEAIEAFIAKYTAPAEEKVAARAGSTGE